MKKSILGIDVSKKDLAVTLLLANDKKKTSTFNNDSKGHKELVRWVKKETDNNQILACMEATGLYSEKIADHLYYANYNVSVVNPFRVKAFASSKLTRHKTDKIDATIIAEFAEVSKLRPYKPRDKVSKELRHLYRGLQNFKAVRAQFANHLENEDCLPKSVIKTWLKSIDRMDKTIAEVNERIDHLILHNEFINKSYVNLQTIPGISKITAVAVLAELPDISCFNNARELAAYIGIIPKHRSSGSSINGKTPISRVGSAQLRKALYFPAIVAKQYNPVIKAFCFSLEKKNKHPKQIICAAIRKLSHMIFAVVKHGIPFDPNIKRVSAQTVIAL